ncbi:MAG: hypothetical protein F4148_15235 [Caldilineaceae bacterium SB0675_bin_29]|uniref:Lipoprotein n=1 Tax=Caldilineaceae bacterium SB0675_bin_29 TaxID=2605266 RepID=A0A6B1GAE3_9CHLR|nr:hypothetical protein [Caldilineaceae bacterium SB0675_bin_29]
MKSRNVAFIAFVIAVLAGCVPIPQVEPPVTRPQESKAGLSDLASLFAKWDAHDDPIEYLDLLKELEGCMAPFSDPEFKGVLTDGEYSAFLIYAVSVSMAAAGEEISKEHRSERKSDNHRLGFQYLTRVMETCDED